MSRACTYSVLCVVIVATLFIGAAPTSQPVKGSTAKKLRQVIPEVNFESTKLADCFKKLVDDVGLNLSINYRLLRESGVEQKSPVTLKLSNKPANLVLQAILDKVAEGKEKLGYYITDAEMVYISTAKDIQAQNSGRRRGR